jgi:hypothetical protein
MPIPKTTYVVDKGMPKVKNKDPVTGAEHTRTHDGTKDHFQVYCHWKIPDLDKCAMRRIPCACDPCHAQLNLPWDDSLDWTKQPRFKTAVDCMLGPVLSGENDWKFVTLKPSKNSTDEEQEEELEEVFCEVLHQYELDAAKKVVRGGFGAIDTSDKEAKQGYYLVRWTGDPYMLAESDEVEGCESGEMPAGTYVCEGRYLDPISRSPHWFHYNSRAQPKLFRLQFVVAPDIKMTACNQAAGVKPHTYNSLSTQVKSAAATTVLLVPEEMQEFIAEEKQVREKLDHFELNIVEDDGDYEEDDEEDDQSQVEDSDAEDQQPDNQDSD